MQEIGVVGLSYRHAGVEEVARLALARDSVPAQLPALRDRLQAAEALYVGTCNRIEVVYATADGAPAGDARAAVFRMLTGRDPAAGEQTRLLRAWVGEAAVEHLFLVACGLDSAQTGEQEIATQLRGAWTDARAAHTCGPVLDRLMGDALGMARRVRRLTAGVRAPSLGDLAVERVRAHLGAHLGAHAGRVALLGVSPMTRRCATALAAARVPLLVVNRTLQTARELAASVGAEALGLEKFRSDPPPVAALVLAAGGGGALLDAAALARVRGTSGGAPLVVDFGVPPNVEPAAAQQAGLPRIGMDDLIDAAQGRRLAQLLRLAPVRAAIDDQLARLRTELTLRTVGPQLADLRAAFERIAAQEVARALKGGLRGLDAEERSQLERLACTVAHRLAHLPLAGLRAAAVHAGTDAVEAFLAGAHELRREATRPRAGRASTTTEKT